jgi:hypothetical protein
MVIARSPLLRAQVARRLPAPTNFRERVALELDGFPEYIAEVTAEQRKAIDELAIQIIKSNQTNDPIFAFRVEGHADIARRIPNLSERKWFEDNISSERAQNGFDLLVEAIKRNSADEALTQKIAAKSSRVGHGTRQLKVPNASTEPQFRKNRRVVFIINQVTFIPPPPEPAPHPTSIVEDRYSVRLIKGAVITVGMPTPKPVPVVPESITVTATLEVTDHIDKKRAQFNVLATGAGFGGGPIPIGGSITNKPGPEVRFKTFRITSGRNRSDAVDLANFAGSVTVFMDAGTGVGPKSVGGTLSFSFDALEEHGFNTNPRVVKVPGGDSVKRERTGC